ncbi:hypothetical protein APHDU1_0381 [Anaplasma phagocytophilum]|uniref:Uncharacterized protein n=1 Tax=Anaplasma phagocytophilum str. NCH-1 TaxID=1359161 RepID=A0A0F3N4G5_ANAPH|nr:hypothetical protein YYU_04895 [Anaplasma phagocytophilum str. HZ2]AGR80874.1 hypothetical protein WSQ_04925 [Anaplasma phagocytophilum str. JM]AGR82128.1 hypothetical protein YYY_04925 [Anaplasma phagocytophilum str. Dog2]EOA61296.1 hypothetical protein HGE1_04567 [Anaplasma phagocytophilum str. HGE1]KJV59535.1 hypothetical protein APHWEB_0916 [Anaplasma phagocytophilum str. Webster]KJV62970.1 hypothetical protein EPHNCH_1413 [Anaplasma phagocytophilum str. NCH-1]KJV82337.1 hypothetical p
MQEVYVFKYYLLQITTFVTFLGLAVALQRVYSIQSKHKEEVVILTKDISKMKAEINNAHNHEIKLNNNFSVWRELHDSHVYGGSEEVGIESLFSELCHKHRISMEEVSVSESVDVSAQYEKQYIKVEKSRVRMKFSALTDKHAVLFIQAVRYDVPGFVALKHLKIVKKREVTQEVIEANSSGSILPTVSCHVEFELYKISGCHV